MYLELEITDRVGDKLGTGATKYMRLQVSYGDDANTISDPYVAHAVLGSMSSFDLVRHHELAKGELDDIRVYHVLYLAKKAWDLFKITYPPPVPNPSAWEATHFAVIMAFALRSMCLNWAVLDTNRLSGIIAGGSADGPTAAVGILEMARQLINDFMTRWDTNEQPRLWNTGAIDPVDPWASYMVGRLRRIPKVGGSANCSNCVYVTYD